MSDYVKVNLQYVSSNEATHISYGYKKGNFILNDTTLRQICETDYFFKNYCFVEVKTPYYALMFDFDFHANHTNALVYMTKADDIVDHIINCINKTLEKIFVNPNTSYVYSDKNIGTGVHLYYPNIIVNKSIHQYIYNDVIIHLINENKFNLPPENLKNIFDACVTRANGLRYPFFYKDSTYYKINDEKSTYDIPVTKYEKIRICDIRRNNKCEYPELRIKINIDDNLKTKIKTKIKKEIKIYTEPTPERFVKYIPTNELDGLLSCFREDMFINYDDWNTMGWFIYNCNNTTEGLYLFYKYSRVGKYKNVQYNEIKQHFYKYKINNYFNPKILYYQSRRENPKLFDTLELNIDYDKRGFTTIEFNAVKLVNIYNDTNDKYIEKTLKTFMEKEFELYANSQNVFFIVKSPYGTGKTTMIHYICKKYNYKRILFITHRQSLAMELMKTFGELNFHNYLDKSNFSSSADRLIVNIDSLHLLKEKYNFFTEKSNLKEFDLIILDECESALHHFESSLMDSNKDFIYSIFHDLIDNTKKIVCFDGDISNRSYQYFRRFDTNIKIYENMYVPKRYHYVIGYDEQVYIDSLTKDLENGLNCAVISMSAAFCEKVNHLLGDKYEVLMIIAKSDDEIKKKMYDSEKILKTKQLFMFSPSITVGVDINFKHFDKLYGYVCNKSVTARDFMQMLARIRNPSNLTINLLVDGKIPKSKIANFYEYEEVKLSYANQYNFNPNDLTTFQVLRLWNKFEDINNKLYIFPILLYYIKAKGHTYEIKDEKPKKFLEKMTIGDIINAENIDDAGYELLLKKQKDRVITQKERLSIEKYLYSKVFKTDINLIDDKFMKARYGKLNVPKNHKIFIKLFEKNEQYRQNDEDNMDADYIEDEDDIYEQDDENYEQDYEEENYEEENYEQDGMDEQNENDKKAMKTYDGQNQLTKMTYIKTVINKLGFTKVNDTVTREDFEKNIKEMTKIIDENFRIMFDMKKEKVDKISRKYKTNKMLLGFVNGLINGYGIEITAVRKTVRINRKITRIVSDYKLGSLDIIKN